MNEHDTQESKQSKRAARKTLDAWTRRTLDEIVAHSRARTGRVARAIEESLVALAKDTALAPIHREALSDWASMVSQCDGVVDRWLRWRDVVVVLLDALRPDLESESSEKLSVSSSASLTPSQIEQFAPFSEQPVGVWRRQTGSFGGTLSERGMMSATSDEAWWRIATVVVGAVILVWASHGLTLVLCRWMGLSTQTTRVIDAGDLLVAQGLVLWAIFRRRWVLGRILGRSTLEAPRAPVLLGDGTSASPLRLARRDLRGDLRQCASCHQDLARVYERGGNATGAAELRRVSNLLWNLVHDEAWSTILPDPGAGQGAAKLPDR